MSNNACNILSSKRARESLAAIEQAQLELVRNQIKALRSLSTLVTHKADEIQKLWDEEKKFPLTKDGREKLTTSTLKGFWECATHQNQRYFQDKVREQGFELSNNLFALYFHKGKAPTGNRIMPFMRAMAGYGIAEAERLERDNPKLSTLTP